jgi:hypothetical protein
MESKTIKGERFLVFPKLILKAEVVVGYRWLSGEVVALAHGGKEYPTGLTKFDELFDPPNPPKQRAARKPAAERLPPDMAHVPFPEGCTCLGSESKHCPVHRRGKS